MKHDVPLTDQAVHLLSDGLPDEATATALTAIADELRRANHIAVAAAHYSRNERVEGNRVLDSIRAELGLVRIDRNSLGL